MANNYTNAEMADKHSRMAWQTATGKKHIVFTRNYSLATES
jgi:hypothetical protein